MQYVLEGGAVDGGGEVRMVPLVVDSRGAREKAEVLVGLHTALVEHLARSRSLFSPTHMDYVRAKAFERYHAEDPVRAFRAIRRGWRVQRVIRLSRLARGK